MTEQQSAGGSKPSKSVLTLQTIGDVDKGRVALAVNQALRLCAQDVNDRPADKSARKVVLTIEMRPVLDSQTAALDTINNAFTIEKKVPKLRSAEYPMLPTPDGRQMFEPASPFDPRQQTFAYADPPNNMNKDTGEVPDVDDEETSPM